MAESARGWRYHDRYNVATALEEMFPNILAQRPDLQIAVAQAKMATAYIDTEMNKLADAEDDIDDH